MYYWNKPMETIGREDLERIQLERLQRTVRGCIPTSLFIGRECSSRV